MKFRLSTGIAALVCVLLASCYPYDENSGKKKATKKTEQTAAEQAKAKEAEARKKAEEDLKNKKKEAEAGGDVTTPGGTTGTTPPDEGPKPPVDQKRTDYAFANKVPGKEGFVFSPYNNKVVDVRDIPSGTLVQDPTYPASEKKYFRVP